MYFLKMRNNFCVLRNDLRGWQSGGGAAMETQAHGKGCTHKVNSSSQARSVVFFGRTLESFWTGSFSWTWQRRLAGPGITQRQALPFPFAFKQFSDTCASKERLSKMPTVLAHPLSFICHS